MSSVELQNRGKLRNANRRSTTYHPNAAYSPPSKLLIDHFGPRSAITSNQVRQTHAVFNNACEVVLFIVHFVKKRLHPIACTMLISKTFCTGWIRFVAYCVSYICLRSQAGEAASALCS